METLARKTILFIITKSNWGGAQAYVFTLARAARDAGAQVAVALGGTGKAGADAGLLAERLGAEGIRTIFLGSFARDISARREFGAFGELLGVIRHEKPDVLHVNSSKAGGLGALAGRLAGVPRIVFTAHGWAHREPRTFPARLFIRLASWVTVILAHCTITVSSRDSADAPALFARRKVVLVHNGIGSAALPDRIAARAKLLAYAPGIPQDAPLIVAIGELTRNKAHEVLLDALAHLTQPYACLIIGDGEARAALAAHAKVLRLSAVAFAGFVPDAGALLTGADLFALPSRKEGLPFVLLEAGRAGCAAIASATGGIPDLVTDGETGLLVPPGDAVALARALDSLLADPARRQALGQALKTRVERDFSETGMVGATLALYA
ncbi:MAG TPA: glycosyltransferase [Candidatus Paceibacterota bacterium]|nr:glycosyltransferase [Candidatus Paceibacterota bacterium]